MNTNEKFEGQNDLLNLLPKKVIESSELSKSAKLVLADIIFLCGTNYANENGCCYRSNEDLMKDTHIKSRETLSTCLAKLCTMNYITREAGVRGQASTYCINHKMLEIEKQTQSDDKNVTTGNDVAIGNLLAEIRLLRQEISELKGTITSILGYSFKKKRYDFNEKGYDLGYGSNKIGYGLGYDSDKIRYDLGVKNGEKGYDRTENRTTDTDTDTEILIATSDSRYTGNASVVKNETTVTLTTDESKKIFDWVKKTLDEGKELLSNYRDTHTREEADESWRKITKLTSLMDKAIAKNKLTEKQCEMLYEYKATASMANDSKEKYLSKVSGSNNVTSVTTTKSTVTSSESSSYHPDGNGYCNGKFIECEFETKKNEASGKVSIPNKSVGEMFYKLHKLSGQEKSDYQLHVNEVMTAYGDTTSKNFRKELLTELAEKGEEAFLKMLKSIKVEIEEDVEADEIGTPNEDNLTSETTVTEPSKNEERAYGEDDFDHFTKGTEEKTSLRDNSRRLDFDNLP